MRAAWAGNTSGTYSLIACLAALAMASEASAGGLFPRSFSFAAGGSPRAVAVADLDGDTVPDLVTANSFSNDVTVLINLPEPSQFLLATTALAIVAWLRRRSQSRVGMSVG